MLLVRLHLLVILQVPADIFIFPDLSVNMHMGHQKTDGAQRWDMFQQAGRYTEISESFLKLQVLRNNLQM